MVQPQTTAIKMDGRIGSTSNYSCKNCKKITLLCCYNKESVGAVEILCTKTIINAAFCMLRSSTQLALEKKQILIQETFSHWSNLRLKTTNKEYYWINFVFLLNVFKFLYMRCKITF